MSYMQARKAAADAGKKSFKYTTKDGETRKYELVEGKKGAMLYKCVENCAEKKKRSPRKKSSRKKSAKKKIYKLDKEAKKALKKELERDIKEIYTDNKKAIDIFIDTFRVSVKDPVVLGYHHKYNLADDRTYGGIYGFVLSFVKKHWYRIADITPQQSVDMYAEELKEELKRERKRSRKRSRRANKKAKDCALGERYVKGKGCVMRKQSQFAGKFMPEFGGGDQCSTLLAGHYLSRIQNAIIDLEARRDGLSLPAIKKYLNADESEYSLIKAALRRGVECGFLKKHKGKWTIKKYLKM